VAVAPVTDGLALSLDVSAVPDRLGGAGYYTMALAKGLAARPDVDLALVTRRGDGPRWERETRHVGRVVPALAASRPGRLVSEQLRLPSVLGDLGVVVHHGPHYTMPARAPVPCAVTIHDCTFFDHPEWHQRSKTVFFRRAIRRAARHAAVLVCVSRVTEERLRHWCEVRAPVVVAPHGVDHERFSPEEPSPGADEAVLARVGVPTDRPLVVFVGTLEPRKGVPTLVASFDRVAKAHPDAVLVLGGQPGWGLAATERALVASMHGDRIIRTGYLPDAAVPALLRRAAVAAYPALEEGFGLPALEALACGAPLVTTEGTAMAEVAGGAALLVRPGADEELAHALDAALAAGRADPRADLGRRVAAGFTWEASVDRHVAAYSEAISDRQ
jgi:glycosyltransferase involved in cell wall biosynthesis